MATDDLHAPLGLGRPAAGSAHRPFGGRRGAGNRDGGGRDRRNRLVRTAHPQLADPRPAAGRVPGKAGTGGGRELTGHTPCRAGPSRCRPDHRSPAPSRRPEDPTATRSTLPRTTRRLRRDAPSASSPSSTAGARQEVRTPATSEGADTPLPDPGLADPLRGGTVLGADDAPESLASPPLALPPRAKPGPPPQKRTAAKPGQTLSTNSATQAPLR